MRAKKSLGQNFLMHRQTAARIADAAGLSSNDTVVEIGPGTGMLTRELLSRAKKVVAIEADHALYEQLKETFRDEIKNGTLELVQRDIRTFDTETISSTYVVVANIPYYITGEIIRQFLTAPHKPSSMTLLVQKEVAERIARSKKESLLSLSVKAYGVPVIRFSVPRGAFVPAPNVDSAVLSITNIDPNAFQNTKEERGFFRIVRAGFAHKRKRLAKNLEDVAPAKKIQLSFAANSLSVNARAEDLSLLHWRAVVKALVTK